MTLSADSWEQDIAGRARSTRIKRLHELWEKSSQAGPPTLKDMISVGLGGLLEHCALLVPEKDGHFTYVHYGRALVESTGVDRSGCNTSVLPPMPHDYLERVYGRALQTGRPIYVVNVSQMGPLAGTWERLVVPVGTEGQLQLLIVLAEPHELHEDLATAILEASPDAIIALRAVEDDLGSIYDAQIVAANESACRVMRRSRGHLLHARLLQLLPLIRDNGMWELCCEVIETRQPSRFDIDLAAGEAAGPFRITLFPLYGGFAMMLQDITDLSGDAIPLIRRRASNIQHFAVNGY